MHCFFPALAGNDRFLESGTVMAEVEVSPTVMVAFDVVSGASWFWPCPYR